MRILPHRLSPFGGFSFPCICVAVRALALRRFPPLADSESFKGLSAFGIGSVQADAVDLAHVLGGQASGLVVGFAGLMDMIARGVDVSKFGALAVED